MVQPTMIKLPIRTRKGKFMYVDWPVIAPHELVASLVSHDCWKQMLVGDADLNNFWAQLFQEDAYSNLANMMAGLESELLLPMRLHGDEGHVIV